MARRATFIKNERANNAGIVLVLDAGNALMGAWESSASRGRVTVDLMNRMGYDAMALGRMDFAVGLDALKQRQAEAQFPMLSANVAPTEGTEMPLEIQAYTIIERQGARIGIIGLSENEATVIPGISDKMTVKDAVETASQIVHVLRSKVDLLIVLSHLGLDKDKALAAAVPGIDIIVGGNTRKLMRKPELVGYGVHYYV
mgnify:CR=1 FL=1